jgi:hypothetical protein
MCCDINEIKKTPAVKKWRRWHILFCIVADMTKLHHQ